MLNIVALALGIVGIVCFIKVLIVLFSKAGVGLGILGIITCGLFAFIWGWVKHKEYGLTKVMTVWTIVWVVSIAINVMAMPAMMRDIQSQQTLPASQP
jgi:hypothetical protein